MDLPVSAGASGEPDVAIDGRRKHVSLIIISMLADQVHTSGGAGHDFGCLTKCLFEGFLDYHQDSCRCRRHEGLRTVRKA